MSPQLLESQQFFVPTNDSILYPSVLPTQGSHRDLLREMIQDFNLSLAVVSRETGLSLTTLRNLKHDRSSQLSFRTFNKLLRFYCYLHAKQS